MKAPVRPMPNRVTFAGDPELDCGADPSRLTMERCAYATAILRRRDPGFAGDLRGLRLRIDLLGACTFAELRRCRRTAAHPDGLEWVTVAVVTLPIGREGRPTVDLRGGRAGRTGAGPPSASPAIPAGAETPP